jgi:hypothetical protein
MTADKCRGGMFIEILVESIEASVVFALREWRLRLRWQRSGYSRSERGAGLIEVSRY